VSNSIPNLAGVNTVWAIGFPIPSGSSQANSGTNAPVVLTYAAISGRRLRITSVTCSYDGLQGVGGDSFLRIEQTPGGVIILDIDLVDSGPYHFVFPMPLSSDVGKGITITLGSRGLSRRWKLNASVFYMDNEPSF